MKKMLVFCLSLAFLSFSAWSQTPEEILERMGEVFDAHEPEGLVMTMDTKIPILGTMSVKTYSLGEKTRMETTMMGITAIMWSDGQTKWDYDSKKNEVTISYDSDTAGKEDSDAEMFDEISDGYDLSIKKETADVWYIQCKKSRSNKDKDAPKNVEVVVAKETFYPVSLKTSMSGVSVTIRDISFGVSEKTVTFDLADYPGVTVVDKR